MDSIITGKLKYDNWEVTTRKSQTQITKPNPRRLGFVYFYLKNFPYFKLCMVFQFFVHCSIFDFSSQ